MDWTDGYFESLSYVEHLALLTYGREAYLIQPVYTCATYHLLYGQMGWASVTIEMKGYHKNSWSDAGAPSSCWERPLLVWPTNPPTYHSSSIHCALYTVQQTTNKQQTKNKQTAGSSPLANQPTNPFILYTLYNITCTKSLYKVPRSTSKYL